MSDGSRRKELPSLGRIIHVVDGCAHRAGIITAVHDDSTIDATIFFPHPHSLQTKRITRIVLDPTATLDHSWHFPERVEELSHSSPSLPSDSRSVRAVHPAAPHDLPAATT